MVEVVTKPYTTSTDLAALRATIAMLLEERDQARRDADGWYTRALAAEQRERALQGRWDALRETEWQERQSGRS